VSGTFLHLRDTTDEEEVQDAGHEHQDRRSR
jgi:hypothetical protein